MYCQKCGKEIMDEAMICIHCGCPTGKAQEAPVEEDKVNVGLCVLSFFIPLFGIIYWAIKAKEKPKAAKACGITAIVAWVCSFILGTVFASLITMLMAGMVA